MFAAKITTVLATSISGLCLGIIVNESTKSPLLTSFAMFAPSLANMLGATSLMSLADSSSPRALATILQLGCAACVGAQALPLPIWMRFLLLTLSGLLMAILSGLQFGVVARTVEKHKYAMARSLLNLSNGAMQICGYALGGVLIHVVSQTQIFLSLGLLMALAAGIIFWGIIPTNISTTLKSGRTKRSVFAETKANNKWAVLDPKIRILLLALWIPNGIIVGAESLFISYAHEKAGYLLAAGAVGMLCGDLVIGRYLRSDTRNRINVYQRVLLAAPYLLFCFVLPWTLAAPLVLIASLGFSASLGLQERLVALTPEDRVGHVQGLESSGRVSAQGVFALAAGGTAEVLGAGYTISVFGALSLLVTALLVPRLTKLQGSSHQVPLRPNSPSVKRNNQDNEH
ncbi:MFS transporter [Paucibacter sp. B2R-40]|nr:MFS transporter [Paucibacter sp. B2R-40]